jgi:hypothetical protein
VSPCGRKGDGHRLADAERRALGTTLLHLVRRQRSGDRVERRLPLLVLELPPRFAEAGEETLGSTFLGMFAWMAWIAVASIVMLVARRA